jgi:hypothetical protein
MMHRILFSAAMTTTTKPRPPNAPKRDETGGRSRGAVMTRMMEKGVGRIDKVEQTN